MSEQIDAFRKQFIYYKHLADGTIEQLSEAELQWRSDETSNSIAIIMNHIAGNQLSRFTDFLTSDGEKDWRNRDAEFEAVSLSIKDLLVHWESGWKCLFDTLDLLQGIDLQRIVYIRGEAHTVFEALLRQLAHYASHVGQIMLIGKMLRKNEWKSLSIPKGESATHNETKFNKPKTH
ncbi:MAG: DUF1572 domain-containing protein [Spirosomaceae bacterium]|nr:DUF1572 domain-containing protein [Spirosomataceae bacterium]